jgi:hypothetical protein
MLRLPPPHPLSLALVVLLLLLLLLLLFLLSFFFFRWKRRRWGGRVARSLAYEVGSNDGRARQVPRAKPGVVGATCHESVSVTASSEGALELLAPGAYVTSLMGAAR